MSNRFPPELIKLANYMGFFIEWKYQIAIGKKEFYGWVGYGGVRFSRVEMYDYDGGLNEIMSFEEYCGWNDMPSMEQIAWQMDRDLSEDQFPCKEVPDFIKNYKSIK